MPEWLRTDDDGVRLRVHVTTGARGRREPGFEGVVGDELQVRVAAKPVESRANRELEMMVAKIVGLAQSAVTVVHGTTSRHKLLAVRGTPEDLVAKLTEAADATQPAE